MSTVFPKRKAAYNDVMYCNGIKHCEMEVMFEECLREKVRLGDTNGVQKLLNIGVFVNAPEPGTGWTPLHMACREGYLDIAALLLKHGADKNLRTDMGETPASVCSNEQILHLLTSDDPEQIMYDSSLGAITSTPPDFLHAAANQSKVRNNVYDKSRLVTSSFQDGSIN